MAHMNLYLIFKVNFVGLFLISCTQEIIHEHVSTITIA